MPWAIQQRTKNRLDGDTTRILGRHCLGLPAVPDHVAGFNHILFRTRAAARGYIDNRFGYLRKPEYAYLRKEPHGWYMPKPVKVNYYIELKTND